MRDTQHWILRGAVILLALSAAGCREIAAPVANLCTQPAPLLGRYDAAAPGFTVRYREGVEPVAETSRLAGKYDFTPTHVYAAAIHGFAASLTSDAVANLRCETSVAEIEHDAVAQAQ